MPIQIVLQIPLGELPPGGVSQLPIFGQPGHPDQGLPGGGGTPTQPIYHPGHPDHGLPGTPDQGLPPSGGRPKPPIAKPPIPGLPDQGLPPGTPVAPGQLPIPEPPPELASSVVVAVHKPGDTSWTVTSFPIAPDQGLPQPQPTPTPQQ